jgi:D-xylose transport system permease protein
METKTQSASEQTGFGAELVRALRGNLQTYTILLVLVGIWLLFFVTTGGSYLEPRNVSNLFRQMTVTAFLATGMVLIIVAGHIDLSVGKMAGFVSVVVAYLQYHTWHDMFPDQPLLAATLSVIVGLIVGALSGALQGYVVAFLNIPAFIVTLGGQWLFNGLILIVTEGKTIAADQPVFSAIAQGYVPVLWGWVFGLVVTAFLYWNMLLGRRNKRKFSLPVRNIYLDISITGILALAVLGYIFYVNNYQGVQNPVLFMGIVAMIVMYVGNNTRFGRYTYAIGGNKEAARLSGINIRSVTFRIFILMGLLSGAAGVMLASYVGYGTIAAGTGYELDAIASCVLGGTSLMGGIGTIPGALVGALIISSLGTGLQMMNVAAAWQYVLKAIVLVLAVLADVYFKKSR